VIDASDFNSAERHVGDKIELIGKIVEVKADVGRRGKGKNKPYVFINFGPWRGSIVKISIWSEGLGKLKEQPSSSWVGRWVSVTGLLDQPYKSPRYGYTHLSITVQEDGQIQRLEQSQAAFRLFSVGRSTTLAAPSTSKTEAPPKNSPKASTATTANKSQPTFGNKTPSNSDILKQFVKPAPIPTSAKTQPTPTPQPTIGARQAAPQQTLQSFLAAIPMWVWAIAGLILFVIVSNVARP
jgi:hypothetical protein